MDAGASAKTPLVLDDLVRAGPKDRCPRPPSGLSKGTDCDLCGQSLTAPPPSSWGSAPPALVGRRDLRSRGPTVGSPGEAGGAEAHAAKPPRSCALCAVEEEFCCRDCYVPWSPKWLFGVDFRKTIGSLGHGTTDLRKEGLRLLNKLSRPGAFVCYQCLVEEECGFSVKPHLSAEQKARWDFIEARAESRGGFPPLRLISRRTIQVCPARAAWGTKSPSNAPA